jgi:glucosamine-6-phosphate deaminase
MIQVYEDRIAASRAAAHQAAAAIRNAIAQRGGARIVAATAASQLAFLEALTAAPGIDWPRVEAFHLDEYIGLPITHPGSFRRMLREHLIDKTGITRYHLLDGERDPAGAAAQVGQAIAAAPIDVAFLGIGENGHLAFNDPPADFETEEPYLLVALDEASRRQQVGEAWFADLSQVPTHALSMSVRQILKSRQLIVVVPDARKAAAIHACFDGPLTPQAPASILRTHPAATIYLDRASASQLRDLDRRPDVTFPGRPDR